MKIVNLLVLLLIFIGWIWGLNQIYKVDTKLSVLESNVDKIAKQLGVEKGFTEARPAGYDVTVDMWRVFENELQDYKQRIREGKRQYDEQTAAWNNMLAEMKKNLQEYDKFIGAEGEFWEKQLRNYEKLLAKNEERFEALSQLTNSMEVLIADFKTWWESIDKTFTKTEMEKESVKQTEESSAGLKPQVIKGKIKSTKDMKTYPWEEEQQTETETVIKPKVSGSGTYKTY